MKRLFLVITFLSLAVTSVLAHWNPEYAGNTVRAEYGALIPMETVSNRSYGLLSLSFSHRFSSHWGWRTGLQYAPVNTDVRDYLGVPFAVVYGNIANSPRRSMREDTWDYQDRPDRFRSDVFSGFFSFFFQRSEVFAGITPGYLFGEIENRFSLSADAGVTLSIPVGRFSLDVTPAFHYLLTDNFTHSVGQPEVKPLHWQCSISGGLSYHF